MLFFVKQCKNHCGGRLLKVFLKVIYIQKEHCVIKKKWNIKVLGKFLQDNCSVILLLIGTTERKAWLRHLFCIQILYLLVNLKSLKTLRAMCELIPCVMAKKNQPLQVTFCCTVNMINPTRTVIGFPERFHFFFYLFPYSHSFACWSYSCVGLFRHVEATGRLLLIYYFSDVNVFSSS